MKGRISTHQCLHMIQLPAPRLRYSDLTRTPAPSMDCPPPPPLRSNAPGAFHAETEHPGILHNVKMTYGIMLVLHLCVREGGVGRWGWGRTRTKTKTKARGKKQNKKHALEWILRRYFWPTRAGCHVFCCVKEVCMCARAHTQAENPCNVFRLRRKHAPECISHASHSGRLERQSMLSDGV